MLPYFNIIEVETTYPTRILDDQRRGLDWLPKTFDFSFCANVLWADRLVICDLNAVLYRQCVVDMGVYMRRVRVDASIEWM